jgi:hypothetical protein
VQVPLLEGAGPRSSSGSAAQALTQTGGSAGSGGAGGEAQAPAEVACGEGLGKAQRQSSLLIDVFAGCSSGPEQTAASALAPGRQQWEQPAGHEAAASAAAAPGLQRGGLLRVQEVMSVEVAGRNMQAHVYVCCRA